MKPFSKQRYKVQNKNEHYKTDEREHIEEK